MDGLFLHVLGDARVFVDVVKGGVLVQLLVKELKVSVESSARRTLAHSVCDSRLRLYREVDRRPPTLKRYVFRCRREHSRRISCHHLVGYVPTSASASVITGRTPALPFRSGHTRGVSCHIPPRSGLASSWGPGAYPVLDSVCFPRRSCSSHAAPPVNVLLCGVSCFTCLVATALVMIPFILWLPLILA